MKWPCENASAKNFYVMKVDAKSAYGRGFLIHGIREAIRDRTEVPTGVICQIVTEPSSHCAQTRKPDAGKLIFQGLWAAAAADVFKTPD